MLVLVVPAPSYCWNMLCPVLARPTHALWGVKRANAHGYCEADTTGEIRWGGPQKMSQELVLSIFHYFCNAVQLRPPSYVLVGVGGVCGAENVGVVGGFEPSTLLTHLW